VTSKAPIKDFCDVTLRDDIFGSDYISLLIDHNPKRLGSAAFDYFRLYADGMQIDDYIRAVGDRGTALRHIRYDLSHKYISIHFDPNAPRTIPIQATPARSKTQAAIGETLSPAIRAMLIDPNSWWAQHLARITADYLDDLGGPDVCTTAEKAVIRRVGVLTIEMERLEAVFASDPDPSAFKIEMYTRLAKTFHAMLNMTGLERRRPRDITPTLDEYIRQEAAE